MDDLEDNFSGVFDSPPPTDNEILEPPYQSNHSWSLFGGNYGTSYHSTNRSSKRPSKANRADAFPDMPKDKPNLREPSPRLNKGKNTKYNAGEDQAKKTMSTADKNTAEKQSTVSKDGKSSASAAMNKTLEEWKAKDKALKKDELLVLVGDLRKDFANQANKVRSLESRQKNAMALVTKKQSEIEKLEKENEDLQETNKELHDTNKELEERNQDLEENGGPSDKELEHKLKRAEKELVHVKANYDKLKATSSKKIAQLEKKLEESLMASRSKNEKVNEKFLAELVEKTKTIGWGKIKFVQNHQEQIIAAKIMWKHGELQIIFAESKPMTKQMKADFVNTYSDYIRQAIFDKRSYATSEVKKWYKKRWTAGKPTLSLEDLVNCLARKIQNEDEMALFMIYWDELLAKHVGSSKWKDNTKYYNTICGALRSDCEATVPLITPQDEAFLVLSTENHLQRWLDEFNGRIKEDKKDHGGLYTSTKTGQNQYGGWSEQGLELFNRYVKMNEDARKDANCEQVEKDCLQKLREKNGIVASNAEEHIRQKNQQKNAKKRGNTDAPMPPAKKVVRTLEEVDSSDDDDNDDNDESESE